MGDKKTKSIDEINNELKIEKLELDLMRKQNDLNFRSREYDFKIKEALHVPERLKAEKHNYCSKVESDIDNLKKQIELAKEES